MENQGNRELRSFDSIDIRGNGEDYIFEGYACIWDTIDSYNSTFRMGAFKKTITERGNKIKVLWNHLDDEPIGKIVEIREDSKGLFVKAQLTKGVTKAEDVYRNLKAGVINELSFGFIVLQSNRQDDDVRQITEVKLFECSPVCFPAQELAVITSVRAEDFDETVVDNLLRNNGWKLLDSLYETIDDVWWSDNEMDTLSMLDVAISKFHSAYLKWAREYMDRFWETRKLAMAKNGLAKAFVENMHESLDDLSKRTSFTMQELRALSKGKILAKESRKKLVELPESIRSAHQQERSKVVENLCNEIRESGFTEAEAMRFSALLKRKNVTNSNSILSTLASISKNQLNK